MQALVSTQRPSICQYVYNAFEPIDTYSIEREWGQERGRLTRGSSVKVVVVLGDVGENTEAVGNLEGHHVFCVQQGWDTQLLLCNSERLEGK